MADGDANRIYSPVWNFLGDDIVEVQKAIAERDRLEAALDQAEADARNETLLSLDFPDYSPADPERVRADLEAAKKRIITLWGRATARYAAARRDDLPALLADCREALADNAKFIQGAPGDAWDAIRQRALYAMAAPYEAAKIVGNKRTIRAIDRLAEEAAERYAPRVKHGLIPIPANAIVRPFGDFLRKGAQSYEDGTLTITGQNGNKIVFPAADGFPGGRFPVWALHLLDLASSNWLQTGNRVFKIPTAELIKMAGKNPDNKSEAANARKLISHAFKVLISGHFDFVDRATGERHRVSILGRTQEPKERGFFKLTIDEELEKEFRKLGGMTQTDTALMLLGDKNDKAAVAGRYLIKRWTDPQLRNKGLHDRLSVGSFLARLGYQLPSEMPPATRRKWRDTRVSFERDVLGKLNEVGQRLSSWYYAEPRNGNPIPLGRVNAITHGEDWERLIVRYEMAVELSPADELRYEEARKKYELIKEKKRELEAKKIAEKIVGAGADGSGTGDGQTPKRKRGRPRKNPDGGTPAAEFEAVETRRPDPWEGTGFTGEDRARKARRYQLAKFWHGRDWRNPTGDDIQASQEAGCGEFWREEWGDPGERLENPDAPL